MGIFIFPEIAYFFVKSELLCVIKVRVILWTNPVFPSNCFLLWLQSMLKAKISLILHCLHIHTQLVLFVLGKLGKLLNCRFFINFMTFTNQTIHTLRIILVEVILSLYLRWLIIVCKIDSTFLNIPRFIRSKKLGEVRVLILILFDYSTFFFMHRHEIWLHFSILLSIFIHGVFGGQNSAQRWWQFICCLSLVFMVIYLSWLLLYGEVAFG